MLRDPKFQKGDTVSFEASNGVIVTGEIHFVDVYGYFIDSGEVLYDVKMGNTLYKKVRESELELVQKASKRKYKGLVERM